MKSWVLFIDGRGDTGVPFDWAAQRLADNYGIATNVRLRVRDDTGEREATADETKQLADAAARELV